MLQPTDVSINGRKWIIQEVDVPVAVDRPGQAHPLLLASRQVDPLLTDLSLVASYLDFKILGIGRFLTAALKMYCASAHIENEKIGTTSICPQLGS